MFSSSFYNFLFKQIVKDNTGGENIEKHPVQIYLDVEQKAQQKEKYIHSLHFFERLLFFAIENKKNSQVIFGAEY